LSGLPVVVQVFRAVGVDERVDGGVPAPVHLHENVITAQADRGPHADHRVAAQQITGHLKRDRVDVVAGEVVVPGPLESVQGAFHIGEERVAAQAGGQPDRTGPADLDGRRGGIEADRDDRGQELGGGLRLAGLGAGGIAGGPGLPAAAESGEREHEREIGLRVAVGVDVDPVDRVGVEFRAGRGRGYRGRGARRVRVDDQHRLVRVLCGLEHEQVREVQAPVVAGKLEIVGTEVVRHRCSARVRLVVC
jgi:hypothetical protein